MKHFFPFILFAFLLISTGCAGTGSSTADNTRQSGTEVMVNNPDLGLDTYLRRLTGVRVSGSGASARIDVRGASSSTIQSESRPLFIMDGVRIGRDFSKVYSTINMKNVHSIKVLKLSKATILYGHDGSGGVIEISMFDT